AKPTVNVNDFFAYLPTHQYIFVPTRELWPAASVNHHVHFDGAKIKASDWLDTERAVHQMTWAPGYPMVIEHRLVSGGGWIERKGCSTFNLYRPPEVNDGDADDVEPWLLQVRKLCGSHTDHVLDWFAHRVQRPGEKINHALVLGGAQGIGKDTI